jgi:hypothetical protein
MFHPPTSGDDAEITDPHLTDPHLTNPSTTNPPVQGTCRSPGRMLPFGHV